jgi:hypothetical protein
MKESSPTSFLTDGKSKYAATCNYPLNINRRMSEWIPTKSGTDEQNQAQRIMNTIENKHNSE